jgi:Rieske Fe-S protein
MSEEEQERFEDYLELERYIEQLRLNQSAHPPTNLTPQQMRIYRMAMLFRSASPHVADPRPEFTVQLRERLHQQMQVEETAQKEADRKQVPSQPITDKRAVKAQATEHKESGEPEHSPNSAPVQSPSPQPANAEVKRHKVQRVSRRALLTGGTAAAASLLAGAGIEHAITQQQTTTGNQATPSYQYPALVGNVPSTWHPVASVEQLGNEALRFSTDSVVGYVIRQTADSWQGASASPDSDEQIVAFSAACTHMGCIVHWQESKRQFLCPCHNGTFDAQGNPVPTAHPLYLTSLPRLETKIENGNIYVKVALPPT